MRLSNLDAVILGVYVVTIFGLAQWVSREKAGHRKDAQDYFLASRSLRWWAIGTSLIAANISAEQIIGMSGAGYAIGLGIASYEWMAALTLIIVGKYFLRRNSSNGVTAPRCALSWPCSGSASTCS
jgi:solute:Na+ symporter, SSS family